MRLPCPSCNNILLIESVGTELSAEVSCARCNATIGVTVATTLLSAGVAAETAMSAAEGDHSVVVAIADDDLRSSYAHTLIAAGWQVRQCKEGREALQTMARDVPEVAIIDGGFAPIFGMGLGEIIKKSNVTRTVRLLGLRPGNDNLTPVGGAERTISLTAGVNQVLAEVTRMLPHANSANNTAHATSGGLTRNWTDTPAAKQMETATTETPRDTLASQASQDTQASTGFVSRPLVPKAMPMSAQDEASAATVADSPEHQAAQRLARIIVADVVMYNQSLMDAAARAGTMAQAILPLLDEGKQHYARRIPKEVRDDTRYLEDAISQYVAKHEARMQMVAV